jgi:hypothetical protein
VSSHGRNTFTRSTPCIYLVRCPFTRLQQPITAHCTFSTETAHDPALVAPGFPGHLAQTTSIPRAEAHLTRGASGSSTLSAPKVIHPYFRHRRPAPFGWAVPAQQNSHNSSSISIFIKSPLQNFLRRSEAVRGPKPATRPDVAKCFRRPFSPTVKTVGGNQARRWTPTQQPPGNPSPLRRKAAGGPPRKRAEKLWTCYYLRYLYRCYSPPTSILVTSTITKQEKEERDA